MVVQLRYVKPVGLRICSDGNLTFKLFFTAPFAPVIDTQRTLAYDQLFLCWRLPQDSAAAWHFCVEYRRRGVVPGGASRGGLRGGLARWGWQRLDEVSGTSAVIDRLEMDSVYVLRVKGCNKAGYGEYSEEVYLHTPPAPGERTQRTSPVILINKFTGKSLTLPRGNCSRTTDGQRRRSNAALVCQQSTFRHLVREIY